MPIRRVWIEPGCILCHLSVDECPAVFEIPEGADSAVVRDGVDPAPHEEAIRRAAAGCPVQVIRFEED